MKKNCLFVGANNIQQGEKIDLLCDNHARVLLLEPTQSRSTCEMKQHAKQNLFRWD
jgi:hypothetical protein